ncbi:MULTISPECIES: aspartate--ammonia ligase [unclassified Clostridium]|uniref:aspartate--ammonia ligase n=1 Tax=unclassified Clostridium TaxID=2614128 RepID=UPI00189BFF41|nr:MULTISPECIES: aspartate--ammonia ligase [unclassified Clostridium]MCR1950067.1 aspartate--ammonia ligase [Clostridium sp. DSM 100503]
MTNSLIKTEIQIKAIKDFFEKTLSDKLNLTRVSAPLFVEANTGINDNLNGIERPVSFDMLADKKEVEVVHSLAKWKRLSLKRYGFQPYSGLYTDMNAIRRDEELDNLHSIYVDQWDWEKIILKADRNKEYLKKTVKDIYNVFKETEKYVNENLQTMSFQLPEDIYFITTQELEDLYPELSPKERENEICKDKGAVFLMEIGDLLNSGIKHDGRSPDYDDWTLNGDILVWYPVLNMAYELSSMGIRVDEEALESQLIKSNCEDRKKLQFHKGILQKELPYTIGGGIGQSRICMFFLNKRHIGEVQCSIWDEKNKDFCRKSEIDLL